MLVCCGWSILIVGSLVETTSVIGRNEGATLGFSLVATMLCFLRGCGSSEQQYSSLPIEKFLNYILGPTFGRI